MTFRRMGAAAALAGALATCFTAPAMGAKPDEVWVENVSQSVRPPIPAGMKVSCTTNSKSEWSSTCPVFRYRDRTTWIFSFTDDRSSFALVTYDAQNKIVANVTKKGGRYVWDAMSSNRTQRLMIWGQADKIVYATWADIGATP